MNCCSFILINKHRCYWFHNIEIKGVLMNFFFFLCNDINFGEIMLCSIVLSVLVLSLRLDNFKASPLPRWKHSKDVRIEINDVRIVQYHRFWISRWCVSLADGVAFKRRASKINLYQGKPVTKFKTTAEETLNIYSSWRYFLLFTWPFYTVTMMIHYSVVVVLPLNSHALQSRVYLWIFLYWLFGYSYCMMKLCQVSDCKGIMVPWVRKINLCIRTSY